MVDDRRHAIVWRKGQEFRLELITGTDIDRENLVIQPGFFKEQRDLVAVRGGPVIKVNHGLGAPVMIFEWQGQ